MWQLPLEKKYRKQLDSEIADIANLGGPFAGATTAALFLAEFVGETPWAHVDIAGTMQVERDDSWRSQGRHRVRGAPAHRGGARVHRRPLTRHLPPTPALFPPWFPRSQEELRRVGAVCGPGSAGTS